MPEGRVGNPTPKEIRQSELRSHHHAHRSHLPRPSGITRPLIGGDVPSNPLGERNIPVRTEEKHPKSRKRG